MRVGRPKRIKARASCDTRALSLVERGETPAWGRVNADYRDLMTISVTASVLR